MKMLYAAVLSAALAPAIVCAQQKSPEEAFLGKISFSLTACDIETSMAQTAARLSDSYQDESFAKASACIEQAKAEATKLFSGVYRRKNPKSIKDGLKDVYAKWLTAMDALDMNEHMDRAAGRDFETAANRLKIELGTK